MTPRALLVLLVPVAAVGAGARLAVLVPVGVAGLVVAGLAVTLDARRALGPDRLVARRHHPERLSVRRPAPVTVEVEVRARRAAEVSTPASGRRPQGGARATVRDEVPAAMEVRLEGVTVEAPVTTLRLPGRLDYVVVPRVRGRHAFGRVTVRLDGPWGLGRRQVTVGDPTTVDVDPDLGGLVAYEALGRRGRLAEIGIRSRRSLGEGTEFERIREAAPEDPWRLVNWRATAKTGRLMVTELAPERSQTVVVAVDCGRLMGVGEGDETKLDQALAGITLLIHVGLRSGDRVGLVAFADRVLAAVPPRPGRGQLAAVLEAVARLRSQDAEPDYDELLRFLVDRQRRRALLVVVTDLVDGDQGQVLLRCCLGVRRRHLPLVATVRDPGVEAAATSAVDSVATAYARAVATALLEERATALALIRHSGVDTLDVPAPRLGAALVTRYLDLKHRGRL